MPKFLVELEDGKKFQVEADQQPSPEEISQYLSPQKQGETPFLDISETASSLGRAVTSLPTTTMASLSQAWEGLENPWKRSEGYLSRRQEMQALQDELAASEAEAAKSGDISTVSSAIREATPSLGFSGATLIPSLGAGAGTFALSKSPAAARGAAAATSALMAYRMAGAQFLDDAKERIDNFFQEKMGRPPDEREQEEAYQELLPLARKFGAAEAGPEALGNLALGGAGKYIRRALGGKGGIVDLASNALGKVTGTKAALAGAGATLSEIGTEAVTKVEQDRLQKQFEEGIMRGESPDSVQLADRSAQDYIEGFKEVAPVTIASVGMMGAAGLGPKAISRGIQAIRSPQEQIVEELSMPDPAEIAKTIGESSVEQLAATGNEASAAAQADFNAILDETLGKTPEPTIQPEQAAEEVAPEVTPSPDQLATVEEPWKIKGREWVKKQQANLGKRASDLDKLMNQNVDSVISSGRSFFGDFVDKDGNIDDGKLSAYREIFRSKGKDLVLEKPIGNLDRWKKSGVKNFPVVDFIQPQTPSTPQGVSMPMMVTRDMKQQLVDLGYSKADINAMRPEEAASIIQSGASKKQPPSPEMEMPPPPQGVDMASAPVSPIITEAPIITPEEESLAAKRRADLLSAAAAVSKGKAKAQVSPAVTAMVTPQPATTQENAPPEITIEESVRQEPQDRIESREAEETSVGDQLRGATEGEEVAPQVERDLTKPYANIAVPDLEKLTPQDWGRRRDYLEGKLRNNQLEKAVLLKTPKQNWESRHFNENAKINDVASSLRAAIQDMQLARPDLEADFQAKSGAQTKGRGETEVISRAESETEADSANAGGADVELRRESETLPSVSGQPKVSAKLGDTTSGSGKVQPDDSGMTNSQKFAAKIRAQFKADELADKAEKLKEKYYSINTSAGRKESEAKDKTFLQWKQTEARAKQAKADAFAELRKQNKGFTIAQLEDLEPFMVAKTLEQHGLAEKAIDIGYVKQGDLYVFQPQTTKAAAETQTADPSAKTPSSPVVEHLILDDITRKLYSIRGGLSTKDAQPVLQQVIDASAPINNASAKFARSLIGKFPDIKGTMVVSFQQFKNAMASLLFNNGKHGFSPEESFSAVEDFFPSKAQAFYDPFLDAVVLPDGKEVGPSVVAHEVGHAIEDKLFKNAPQRLKSAILDAFNKHVERVQKQPIVTDYMPLFESWYGSDKARPYSPDMPITLASTVDMDYIKSFSEWFANQVSRWATSHAKPLSLVDEFFSKIASKIKELFYLVKEYFAPETSVVDYIHSLVETGMRSNLFIPSEAKITQRKRAAKKPSFFDKLMPSSQTTAAETQTPESTANGLGGSRVASSSLEGGRSSELPEVSTETESESSGKLDTVAQIDRLVQSGAKPEEMDKFVKSLSDDQFNELVSSEAFDVDPKLAIKPKDTYDAKRIKRRKFVDAVNAATKDVRKTAQQVFQEEEAAVKQQEKLEQATKSSLNAVVGPQKKNPVQGTVTKADVEAAREALTNSGEIPNAYLTNVYESREAFLADKANARLFPATYARLKIEDGIEGLFSDDKTFVFANDVVVSDLDRNIAKSLGITPIQAAARRVIIHESGHGAISFFTMAEKRELRGYLMQAYSDEQVAKLVEKYTEYADWRTNPESRLEALEELLMRDFEKMEKIPTGGVWDDIVQFLKRVWRRLTGQKGEPKLKELKDVVRLMRNAMKRPAVPLGSYTLKDGSQVKLSMIAQTARITPEMDAEYLAAVEVGDMEKAQRMVDEAAKAAGYVIEAWHSTFSGPFTEFDMQKAGTSTGGWLPVRGMFFSKNRNHDSHLPKNREGLRVGKFYLRLKNPLNATNYYDVDKKLGDDFDQRPDEGLARLTELGNDSIVIDGGEEIIAVSPSQIKSADPVTRDDAGNVIPLSQRFQTTSSDIRFSRPEFPSETSAAFTAGSEAARSTLYSERDMDIREAIRRAYEAMPKQNSVAVQIGELFDKVEELMPGVTQDEFSNVLQDLFEDNGAVLQEGNVVEPSPGGLTEAEVRKGGAFTLFHRGPAGFSFEAPMFFAAQDIGESYGKELRSAIVTINNPATDKDVIKAAAGMGLRKNGLKAYEYLSPNLMDSPFTEKDIKMIILYLKSEGFDGAVVKDFDVPFSVIPFTTAQITPNPSRASGGTPEINVTTPEGRRAGFVVVMPRGAKASRIKAEDVEEASKSFKSNLVEAGKGRMDTEAYQGHPLKDTDVPEHKVKAYELYRDGAIKLIDDLLAKTNDIVAVAESLQDPNFQIALGLQVGEGVSSDMITIARQLIGVELQNRLRDMAKKERDPVRKRQIEQAEKTASAYYSASTGAGQALQNIQQIQEDPRYKSFFLFEEAAKHKEKAAKEKLDAITGGTEKITETVKNVESEASKEASDTTAEEMDSSVEDDQDAADLKAGEETLTGKFKALYEELKDLIREEGIIAGLMKKAGSLAKASISAERRNELASMTVEELQKRSEKNKKRIGEILESLLGKESDAKTPEQKKTRQKRKKGIETLEKRAKKGKPLDISDSENLLKTVIREMGKARPGKTIPLKNQMPWREILSQSADNAEMYRERILNAMMQSEEFKDIDDADKALIADIFAKQWQAKRDQIIDRMLEREIDRKMKEGSIAKEVAKQLQKARNKILEIINLGGFNNDDLVKILGEKFGIKTEFTEQEKERISDLAEKLQNEDLNPARRNKLAMEFAVALAGATDASVAEILSNWWTSSVLFGPQTIFSIGAAFVNGAYSIVTVGTQRVLSKLAHLDTKGAIEESILILKGIADYLGAFKQAGRRAWSYLWTGNVDALGASANDILGDIKSLDDLRKFKRHKLLAENLAKDPKALRRYVGVYLRFINRLLTSLDAFNVMVTKAGTASLALRMSGMDNANIIKAEKMLNLKSYKDQVIREYFDNKAPTDLHGKALVDSYAEAEMYRAIDKLGGKMENADYFASESAMTMKPTGVGGAIYKAITGVTGGWEKSANEYLEKVKKDHVSNKDIESLTFLMLGYLRQFAAYNAAGLTGTKFVRYASNKFNQGISFLPVVGLLRRLEAKDDAIQGKEAFLETINRNQFIGMVTALIGVAIANAIGDEPDDEKRGTFWNGGWENLTPDQKKQMLAKGQKEYTIGFKLNGRWYAFNYQNWPLNQILAAIGSISDQIRFSPKQWSEKMFLSKLAAGTVSGIKSTLEIPALSGLSELAGNRLASKDPTEQAVDRFSRVVSGWAGGFVPRILKDLDYATQPELRKYKTLWERMASHVPIYRRYVGEDYYDILGQPIKRNVIPGSREFMMGPTEPEYKILGALNSRNIFLTPANAEYRMVGKGRNRRRLTQEEADAYSLETGKGYRQMLLRYGQRALQMPTERARAFLSDKADEVRDRALKKVYRR